jgi:hypothetical protein
MDSKPSFSEEEKQKLKDKIIDIRKKQINQLQETPSREA